MAASHIQRQAAVMRGSRCAPWREEARQRAGTSASAMRHKRRRCVERAGYGADMLCEAP